MTALGLSDSAAPLAVRGSPTPPIISPLHLIKRFRFRLPGFAPCTGRKRTLPFGDSNPAAPDRTHQRPMKKGVKKRRRVRSHTWGSQHRVALPAPYFSYMGWPVRGLIRCCPAAAASGCANCENSLAVGFTAPPRDSPSRVFITPSMLHPTPFFPALK